MNKALPWILFIGGTILLIMLLASFGSTSTTGSELKFEVTAEDHFKGAEDAKAVIVEYSDFQCPACSSTYPLLSQLVRDYPNDVKVVYRHFPLTSIHTQALSSAQAAEAAGMQGKFWEMHDMLFNTQNSWSTNVNPPEVYLSYAISLGLDAEKFKADIVSDEVKERIETDLRESQQMGLNKTPTLFLNGSEISHPGSYAGFEKLVKAEL